MDVLLQQLMLLLVVVAVEECCFGRGFWQKRACPNGICRFPLDA